MRKTPRILALIPVLLALTSCKNFRYRGVEVTSGSQETWTRTAEQEPLAREEDLPPKGYEIRALVSMEWVP